MSAAQSVCMKQSELSHASDVNKLITKDRLLWHELQTCKEHTINTPAELTRIGPICQQICLDHCIEGLRSISTNTSFKLVRLNYTSMLQQLGHSGSVLLRTPCFRFEASFNRFDQSGPY